MPFPLPSEANPADKRSGRAGKRLQLVMRARAVSSEGFLEVTLSPASSCSPQLSQLHQCKGSAGADLGSRFSTQTFNRRIIQRLPSLISTSVAVSALPGAALISHPRALCSEFPPSSVFSTSCRTPGALQMHEQVLIGNFRPGFLSSIFLLVTLCPAAPTPSGQEEKMSSRQGTAAL